MIGLLIGALRRAGILLYHLGLAPLVIRLRRRTPRIVLYHATEERESDFLRGLESNVQPVHFARQMEFLAAHYQVVDETKIAQTGRPDRALCVTFDDGYRSLLAGAMPTLRALKLPATIYLVSSVMDGRAMAWVNEFNWLLFNRADVCVPAVMAAVGATERKTPSQLIALARLRLEPAQVTSLLLDLRSRAGVDVSRPAEFDGVHLTWDEARALQRESVRFGSHSSTHPNLAMASASLCEAEILDAHTAIARELGSCASFAFPFGSISEVARSAAVSLGYTTVMEVLANGSMDDPHRLARVPAPDAGPAQLFAELEIVHPLKSLLRWITRRQRPAIAAS